MKVFVTGASGFVGRALVSRLAQSGHQTVPWSRRQEGDLTDASLDPKLRTALKGCDAVVHLAAKTSEAPSSEGHSSSVNVEGTAKLASFAKEAGVKKFVFVSSQSAKLTNPGPYGATKKRAEGIVAASGLDYVILRPAIIYGAGEAGIFKKFVTIVDKLPLIPIPYTRVTFQPVFVKDVVDAIVSSMEKSSLPVREYDVAGPDSVSFPGLIVEVAKAKGLKRILLPIPMPLAIFGARLLALVIKRPPVTVDNLLGLSEKTDIDLKPLTDTLKVRPVSLKDGLAASFK